jgi:hypothetical protein
MKVIVTGAAGLSSDLTCQGKLVFAEAGGRSS